MLATKLKIEIAKEVLIKSGFDKDKKVVDSVAEAMIYNRFLFELDNNEVIAFVTWCNPQTMDGKQKIFVNNLWIDPKYRNRRYILRIRTMLRNMFPDTNWFWFNRKKQKLVERT